MAKNRLFHMGLNVDTLSHLRASCSDYLDHDAHASHAENTAQMSSTLMTQSSQVPSTLAAGELDTSNASNASTLDTSDASHAGTLALVVQHNVSRRDTVCI